MKDSRRNAVKRLVSGLMLVCALALMLAFVAGAAPAPVTVRVASCPYPMMVLHAVARDLNLDTEFGLKFETKDFTATLPASQALIRGDIDMSPSCHAEHIAVINNAPQLKSFSGWDLFKGFIYVGRKGKIKPFEQLKKEMGLEKAREFRIKEMKGKTFCVIPQRKPLIADTLGQYGISIDEVKLLNFADDQKAATAFIRGTGDFYMGSLPQERRLLKMKGYVNAGGTEILGPGGLWYGCMIATDDYIAKNRETVLRSMAAMYRLFRLFRAQPMKVATPAAKHLSRMTGGTFSTKEYIELETIYDQLLTVEESKEGYYNPSSRYYWKHPVEFYIKATIESGDLKRQVTAEEYYGIAEELFKELLTRDDLLKLINAPFK